MGTWGEGIFESDIAVDVREEFRESLRNGLSTEEATDRLSDSYGDSKLPGESAEFWLALGLAQWEIGRLLPHVQAEALEAVDYFRESLSEWPSESRPERARVLTRARKTLLKPQQAPAVIRKRKQHQTPFQEGDIVKYTMLSGQEVAIGVVGNVEFGSRVWSSLSVMTFGRPLLPSLDEIVCGHHAHGDLSPRLFGRLLADGKNVTEPRWILLGNDHSSDEWAHFCDQNTAAFEETYAKRPRSVAKEKDWIENVARCWHDESSLFLNLDAKQMAHEVSDFLANLHDRPASDDTQHGWSDAGLELLRAALRGIVGTQAQEGEIARAMPRWRDTMSEFGAIRDQFHRTWRQGSSASNVNYAPIIESPGGALWEQLQKLDESLQDFFHWETEGHVMHLPDLDRIRSTLVR